MIEQLKVIDSSDPFQRSVDDFVQVLEKNPLLDGWLVEDLSLIEGINYLDHKLDRTPVGYLMVGSDNGQIVGSDRELVAWNIDATAGADTFIASIYYPHVILPHAAQLVSVQGTASGILGVAAQFDVYWWRATIDNGTVLSAPMGIALGGFTIQSGVVVTNTFQADDVLHFRVQGNGSVTNGAGITLELEVGVVCNAWDDSRMTFFSGRDVDVNLWVF